MKRLLAFLLGFAAMLAPGLAEAHPHIWIQQLVRVVAKDGKVSEPIEGLPSNLWTHGQGLFEARPDRAFATNHTIYLTYTVLPDGNDTFYNVAIDIAAGAKSTLTATTSFVGFSATDMISIQFDELGPMQ